MANLNSSGPISLGGSTTGQSVNLQLGQSATAQISFNDTAVRTLTGTSAGTALVMPTNFYGKGGFSAFNEYVTGSGTKVAPSGAKNVTIYMWGAGGGGGLNSTQNGGRGGGGGAYVTYTMSVTGGTTSFTYSVGNGGVPALSAGNGGDGGPTTITSPTLTAGGGGGGGPSTGGTAGVATGGQTGSANGSAGGANGGNAGGTGVSVTTSTPTVLTFQGGGGDSGDGPGDYGGGAGGGAVYGTVGPVGVRGAGGAIVFAWS